MADDPAGPRRLPAQFLRVVPQAARFALPLPQAGPALHVGPVVPLDVSVRGRVAGLVAVAAVDANRGQERSSVWARCWRPNCQTIVALG